MKTWVRAGQRHRWPSKLQASDPKRRIVRMTKDGSVQMTKDGSKRVRTRPPRPPPHVTDMERRRRGWGSRASSAHCASPPNPHPETRSHAPLCCECARFCFAHLPHDSNADAAIGAGDGDEPGCNLLALPRDAHAHRRQLRHHQRHQQRPLDHSASFA